VIAPLTSDSIKTKQPR